MTRISKRLSFRGLWYAAMEVPGLCSPMLHLVYIPTEPWSTALVHELLFFPIFNLAGVWASTYSYGAPTSLCLPMLHFGYVFTESLYTAVDLSLFFFPVFNFVRVLLGILDMPLWSTHFLLLNVKPCLFLIHQSCSYTLTERLGTKLSSIFCLHITQTQKYVRCVL